MQYLGKLWGKTKQPHSFPPQKIEGQVFRGQNFGAKISFIALLLPAMVEVPVLPALERFPATKIQSHKADIGSDIISRSGK